MLEMITPTWSFALLVATGLTVSAVTILLLLLITMMPKRLSELPSSPRASLLLGSLVEFVQTKERHYDWLHRISEQHQGEWYWALPGVECRLQLYSPESVEHVLKKQFYRYEKSRHFYDCLHEAIGDGIFNVNGDSWRRQRKVASHLFSMKALRENMFPVFLDTLRDLLDKLDAFAATGEVFDLQNLFFRATLDSIAKVAFGLDLQCVKSNHTPTFALAFDAAQQHMADRLVDPLWKLKRLVGTQAEREFAENIRLLNLFTSQVISSRKQAIASGEQLNDLLSLFMLDAHDKGRELEDEPLRDAIMNFLIAGRDTTACGLSWSFYELLREGQRREVVEELLEEVDARIPDDGVPSYNDVKDLDQVNAHFHETLRLHPPVPTDNKICVEDDVLPNGVRVPAGTTIGYSPYTMGRCSKLWDHAQEFRPERWLNGQQKKYSQYMFPQFNAGPRLCLGKHVAILEAKTFMAGILRRHAFELVPGQEPVRYKVSLTMPIDGGLFVRVRRRPKRSYSPSPSPSPPLVKREPETRQRTLTIP